MIYLEGIDTETKTAIATLAAQFALGVVEQPEVIDASCALEDWGDMGYINPTDAQVAGAATEAIRIADNLSVSEDDDEDSLRRKILGW